MKLKASKRPEGKRRPSGASAGPAKLPFKTILATTDFSGDSLAGVRYAVALGGKTGAAVSLLHVVEPVPSLSGMEAVVLTRTDSEVAALARLQLEALARRESKGAGKITTVVRTGRPFHKIALATATGAADLVVIAAHGHTGIQRALLGSTAERVVRHARCPVLTVPTRALFRRGGSAPAFKLKKILVPIDFSTVSKDALPYAVLLAERFGAEVIIVNVVKVFPIDHLLEREVTNQTMVSMMKQAEAGLKAMAASLAKSPGVGASAIVRQGTPFAEICAAAKTLGADMIVLTTHGYTGAKQVWLGSTAERVVRHAPCPVLVVRAREHDSVDGSPSPIQA